jgi:hypothetical protein
MTWKPFWRWSFWESENSAGLGVQPNSVRVDVFLVSATPVVVATISLTEQYGLRTSAEQSGVRVNDGVSS